MILLKTVIYKWFSKWWSLASSITKELIKNAIFKPHPRPTESDTVGSGPAISTLTSPTRDSDEPTRLRITELMSYKPMCS